MTSTETAAFDVWIADNYDTIKTDLICHDEFDPDTFHDAYLRLSDALTPEIGVSHYRKLFRAIYAEIRRNKIWQSFRSVNVSDLFFELLRDESEEETQRDTETPDPVITAKAIKRKARNCLTGEQFTVFTLRYESNMTFQEIGLYLGKGKDYAKRTSDFAITNLRNKFNIKPKYETCSI